MEDVENFTKQDQNILIVDDNLVAIKLIIRTLTRSGLCFHWARSVEEAFEILGSNDISFVITEVGLPDMDGVKFVSEMRSVPAYENIPVMFFSGDAKREVIEQIRKMKLVDFLLKPMRPPMFRKRIEELLPKVEYVEVVQEDSFLPWIRDIELEDKMEPYIVPSFRATTELIMGLVNQDNVSVSDFAQLIELDPGLSMKVLEAVNSSLYNFPNEVTSVSRACVLIGLRDLRSLCLSSVVNIEMERADLPLLRSCWEHSLVTGQVASRIASIVCPDQHDLVATAGSVHLTGLLAMLSTDTPESEEFTREISSFRGDWYKLERRIFGFDHCMLAGRIIERMGLGDEVRDMVLKMEKLRDIRDLGHWSLAMGFLTVQSYPPCIVLREKPGYDLIAVGNLQMDHYRVIQPELEQLVWDARTRLESLGCSLSDKVAEQ